ncbi:MAG TPA: fibronectin type III domain-containing protein, partial [Candidatus Kapabacteria bacterium]|nr:fibronectin type III domain-containing protein [Candidatus Kapabacteria bacterium]
FENIVFEIAGLTTSSYTYTGILDELSMYWWRIKAVQSDECYSYWSTKWMFITDGDLPAPVLITPENGATGVAPSPQFTWIGHFAATGYHFQLSTTEDFSGIVIDETTLTEPQFTGSGLSMNTQYWWRVEMYNPTSTSPWSEVWSFTTGAFILIGDGTEYNPNTTFPSGYANWYGGCKEQFIIRADEIYAAGGTPGFLMSLGFNVAVLNVGTPLQDYYIALKNTTENEAGATWDLEGFTQVYYSESYTPVAGWNIHNFTDPFFWDGASNLLVEVCFNNLSYTRNESCYWTLYDWIPTRYYQNDNNPDVCTLPQWTNTSNYRPNMQFSLEVPAILPPYLEEPVNNAFCVNTAPLFNWTDVDGATGYALQVATDMDFFNIVLDVASVTESQYQVPAGSALNELTQFYWRTNATDGENISFWSQRWGFITDGDLPVPILISPLSGSLDLAPAQFLNW